MTNSRAGKSIFAVKSADQTKTTDTTYANDTHLVVPVKANKSYSYILQLYVSAGSGGFKQKFVIPSGATMSKQSGAITGSIANEADAETEATVSSSDSVVKISIYMGRITVGATAGTIAFQWAQNSSHANATTYYKGSSITLQESL